MLCRKLKKEAQIFLLKKKKEIKFEDPFATANEEGIPNIERIDIAKFSQAHGYNNKMNKQE